MYGSDAMGGVIYIETLSNQKKPQQSIQFETGSYSSYKLGAKSSGYTKKISYYLGVGKSSTEGFSSVQPENVVGDLDGHEQSDLTLNVGSQIGNHQLDLNFSALSSTAELDDGLGASNDDPNHQEKRTAHNLQLLWGQKFLKQKASLKTGYQRSWAKRITSDPANDVSEDDKVTEFKATTDRLNMDGSYQLTNNTVVTGGLAYKVEQTATTQISPQQISSSGIYSMIRQTYRNIHGSFGVRQELSSVESSSISTYRTSLGFKNITPIFSSKISFGTGFKSPTSYQLYSPDYGNRDLNSETVRSYDISLIAKSINGKTQSELTYFSSHYGQLIGVDPKNYRSINIGQAEISGFEWTASTTLKSRLRLFGNLTHLLRAEDLINATPLVRRPTNSWNFGLETNLTDRTSATLNHKVVGNRVDYDSKTFELQRAPSFHVTSLAFNFYRNPSFQTYLRIHNLLNTTYQEIDGYNTESRGVYFGGSFTL